MEVASLPHPFTSDKMNGMVEVEVGVEWTPSHHPKQNVGDGQCRIGFGPLPQPP